jgi:hypothetical protein
MPYILTPQQWLVQPPYPLELDRDSTLTRGTVFFTVPNDPDGAHIVGNITKVTSNEGFSAWRGAYQNSDNYVKVDRTSALGYTSEVTFEALVKVAAFQTNVFPYLSGVIGQYQSNTGGSVPYYGPTLRFGDGILGNASVPHFTIVQSGAEHTIAGASTPANALLHLLGTYKSGSLDLYVNGVRYTTSSYTGAFDNDANNFISLLSEYVVSTSALGHKRCLNGDMFYARIRDVWTPPDQAVELARNPWQVFRRSPKVLYFNTGSTPQTLSGDLTSSAQAALSLIGDIVARTESADLSANAQAALSLIGDIVARTESADLSASALAVVAAEGSATYTPIGADLSANAQAAVAAEGSATYTPIGADLSASALAAVAAEGSATYTPIGADLSASAQAALLATGQEVVSGALSTAFLSEANAIFVAGGASIVGVSLSSDANATFEPVSPISSPSLTTWSAKRRASDREIRQDEKDLLVILQSMWPYICEAYYG